MTCEAVSRPSSLSYWKSAVYHRCRLSCEQRFKLPQKGFMASTKKFSANEKWRGRSLKRPRQWGSLGVLFTLLSRNRRVSGPLREVAPASLDHRSRFLHRHRFLSSTSSTRSRSAPNWLDLNERRVASSTRTTSNNSASYSRRREHSWHGPGTAEATFIRGPASDADATAEPRSVELARLG